MTSDNSKLYSQQFDNLNRLVGKRINEIVFYLNVTDKEFSEVANSYGKSLHSGIDIKVDNVYYSIGCRFTEIHYGLIISEGRTSEFEFIEEEKVPVIYETNIIGQTIRKVDIYWMKIPWDGAVGFYPQEFVIQTESGFLLLSSIEINKGEVNTEFTDELLIIESEETAEQLQLGPYGIGANGRERFNDIGELNAAKKKNWL